MNVETKEKELPNSNDIAFIRTILIGNLDDSAEERSMVILASKTDQRRVTDLVFETADLLEGHFLLKSNYVLSFKNEEEFMKLVREFVVMTLTPYTNL